MATVSSLLPVPAGHVPAGPSPASPQRLGCSSTSSASRGSSVVPDGTVDAVAATALALPSVSHVPARLHDNRLYPLNPSLQTPRACAAALAATAAADAAKAAAAAARAAVVAAAAAGAATVVGRGSTDEVEPLEQAARCMNLQSLSGALVSAESAAVAVGKHIDQHDTSAAAAPAARSSRSHKADLSLACRPVQRSGEGQTPMAIASMSIREGGRASAAAAALEESESARGLNSIAGGIQQNRQHFASLSRTLSCFSSFSFKHKDSFVPESSHTRTRGISAATASFKKMANTSNAGSDNARSSSSIDQGNTNNNATDYTRAAALAEAPVCGEYQHTEEYYEEERTARSGNVLHAEPKVEEIDVQQNAVKLHQLIGICGETPTERRTTCETSRRGSALPVTSTCFIADASCHNIAEVVPSQLCNSDKDISSSSIKSSNSSNSSSSIKSSKSDKNSSSGSQYSCYPTGSQSSNSSGVGSNDSSKVLHGSLMGDHSAYTSPRYGNSTDGGREGNIRVLGSARQVTPESSRISSRMSCGGDDAALVAHVEFLPLCATEAAGTTRRGAAAAGGGGGGDGVTEGAVGAAEESDDNGGIGQHHVIACIQQKERQQQHWRDNRQHKMGPRCLSMPGELSLSANAGNLHTLGSRRPLTTQDILQLQQQQQQQQRQHQGRSGGVENHTTKNVLTSKYLLSTMKLDLLKLRKAEKDGLLPGSSTSSALPTSHQNSPFTRADIFTPREELSPRTSNPESFCSAKSFRSSSSASSSSLLCFTNSETAAASVVALTRSYPSESSASSSSPRECSSRPSFCSSSFPPPTSFTSFAASLALKGKHLLSTVLPSLLPLVEPPTEGFAAPSQTQDAAQNVAGENNLYNRYGVDTREADTATSVTPECQYFAEWGGYHGVSPVVAIRETEEGKGTRSSHGESTPAHTPTILIQGEDEVEMLRGTSFRRDTIVRHSVERAKELWEKLINCCW